MEPHLNLFRVFIASPGDLKEERKELWNVVEKINSIYAKETNWRIELLGWEDTLPGTGRPQDLINTDLDKADLFIGCVWQRWGSRSGNGAKTGFEEEFDRALARRSTTQCPEMWLFFKEVEPVRMADPGEQLQKVLAFRSREIELKRLLYKEFSTLQEWQELVADLLHRQMLRLLAKNQNGNAAQAPSTASEPPTATNMPDKGDVGSEKGENAKKEEAVSTLLALLSDVEKAIKREGLEFDGRTHLEPNAHARLLLFAAANFSDRLQPITLNSHEINSIYLHREKLNISSPERLLILRTVVTDTTLTKPGWSFVKEAPKLTIRLWLPWLVLYDRDKWTRAALIAQATKIKYPLSRGRNGSAIVDSLLNDNNVTIRSAILQHLTALGTKSDLSRVSQLLSDEDKNVRSLAERVIRIIHLRDNAELETKKSIERRDSFDPELLEIVRQNATSFANETLLAAYDFPNPGLKAVAAQELLKRNLVSKELGNRMCDEDAKGIRECGYLALVTKGEKIDVEKVKRALDDSLWPYPGSDQWWDKADADKVILSFYLKLTEDLLWKEIEECKETSAVALRALGDKYYGTNKDRIRKELADGFKTLSESQKAKAPAVSGFLKSLNWGHSSNSIESARKKLCVVALEIVAEHPVQADRLVFLEALGTGERLDFEQTVAAIRGLRIVGIAEDREKLVRFFSHISLVEAAATRAYLELSPDLVSGAKDLLKEVTTHRLRMIVLLMLRRPEKDVLWKLIEPLLLHDAEDIRRIAVFYACRVLTKKQLKAVLREYLGGPTYYYNVVTVLDRYLYAPRELQLHYQSEDTEFFEKIKPHPKWLVDE